MTRSSWRRTAALAVLCLVSLTGLTGCQTQAGVAAFVGSTRISEQQLRAVADEGLKQQAIAKAVGGNLAAYRRQILGGLVRHQVIAGVAGKLHVSASMGELDKAVGDVVKRFGGRKQAELALGSQLQLPPSQLRPLLGDSVLLGKIGDKLTQGATFTDAEARTFYDTHGGASTGGTFEQLKAQVIAGLRAQLATTRTQAYTNSYLRRVKLRINPRYGRFQAAKLFGAQGAPLIVPLRDDLVRDQPTKGPAGPS